jgi:regulator of replication initiation timing
MNYWFKRKSNSEDNSSEEINEFARQVEQKTIEISQLQAKLLELKEENKRLQIQKPEEVIFFSSRILNSMN